MTAPTTTTVQQAGATVSKVFNWKVILFNVIMVIIVTLIVSKMMKNTVTLYDMNGNPIGTGEVTPQLKKFKSNPKTES